LNEIADICHREGIWLHVDGAWGGTVLMSDTLRTLMHGIERCDSLAANPHKMLGVPLQASMLLTAPSHKNILSATASLKADYLFHDHDHASYDLGDRSFQCGRKSDSFKLWMAVKLHGRSGLASRIELAFRNADTLKSMLEACTDPISGHKVFWIVSKASSPNVCFYLIPASKRERVALILNPSPSGDSGSDEGSDSSSYPSAIEVVKGAAARPASPLGLVKSVMDREGLLEEIGKTTALVYGRMQERGNMLINFNPLKEVGLPTFFRCPFSSPNINDMHLEFIVQQFMEMSADL
jgi:hypothetical protein